MNAVHRPNRAVGSVASSTRSTFLQAWDDGHDVYGRREDVIERRSQVPVPSTGSQGAGDASFITHDAEHGHCTNRRSMSRFWIDSSPVPRRC